MTNYGTEKFKQPSSSNKINNDTASGFYNDFMIPTLKSILIQIFVKGNIFV